MLKSILLFEGLWDSFVHAPFLLACVGGVLVGIGLFTTRGWQPTCRRCQHDLRGVAEPHCPECGADLTARNAVRSGRRQVLLGRTLLGALLIAVAALPHLGLTPYRVRSWLASQLSHREISGAALAGSAFFQQIHNQRLSANDPTYRAAAIDEAIERLESTPFTGAQSPSLRELDRIDSNSPADGPTQRRIAEALVKRAETSPTEANAIAHGTLLLRHLGDPEIRSILLSSEALARGFLETSVPARILRGQPVSAHCTWLGDISLDLAIEPKVTAVRWRPAGSEGWSALTLEQHDRWTVAGAVTHVGPIEVEITATATLPRGAIRGVDVPREVSVVNVETTEIVAPESLRLTKASGADVRARFEPFLSAIQLRRFGSVVQPRFAMPSLRRSATREEPVQFGGRYVILHDGREIEIGTYFHGSSGGGGGGSSQSSLDRMTFDPGKPIVLRIVPDEAALRKRIDSDTSYLDEVVELEFDGFDTPPREVRWGAPESATK